MKKNERNIFMLIKTDFFNEALAISQDSNHIHSAYNLKLWEIWILGFSNCSAWVFCPALNFGKIKQLEQSITIGCHIESNENMSYIDRWTGSYQIGTIEQNGLEFQISQHQSLLIATKRHFWREFSEALAMRWERFKAQNAWISKNIWI